MRRHSPYCLIWLLLVFPVGLLAQETTSSDAEAQRAEIEALEPAVSGEVLESAETLDPAATQVPVPAEPTETVGNGGQRRFATVDELDLGTTSITGNQELPKVLYIVPWKKSDLGDLVGRPVNTLLDEVLSPVDPEVFRRQLNYYEGLYGESQDE